VGILPPHAAKVLDRRLLTKQPIDGPLKVGPYAEGEPPLGDADVVEGRG
jgi:hypothetical protein